MNASPRARWRLPLLAVALVAGFAGVNACEEVTVTEVQVASVSVSPGTATLLPSEIASLSATPRDASGAPLSSRAVAWRSDDPAVATVDAAGRVHAVASGTSRIEATSGGVRGSALITVSPAPAIQLSRSAVELGGFEGGQAIPTEAIQVLNGGGGSLTGLSLEVEYGAGQPSGWLDAVLRGTSAPTHLDLGARPQGLAAGSYAAEVRVTSAGAPHSPRRVQVELRVREATPVIRVFPEALGFSTSDGQGAPPVQTVRVTHAGGPGLGSLTAVVSHPEASPTGWLTAELDGTTAPADLRLRVDPAGLSTGVFDATVAVTSPDAPAGDASVQVRLRFGDPPPQIQLAPGSVQITLEEGSATPRLVGVQVANAGTGALEGLSALVQSSDPSVASWLQASLRAADAPTVLELQMTAVNRLPGIYGAQVVVASPDAINSPVPLGVQLVVGPRPSVSTSTVTATPDSLVANGASTSEITVSLNDLRGAPMPSGGDSVEVFTTAGTLSGVTSQGNGRYRATLVSSSDVQTATVTARLRGAPIQDSATVRFLAGGADAGRSTVGATPTAVRVDSASTIRVQLRDAAGNAIGVSGDAVFLSTDLGSLAPGGGAATRGIFEARFTSPAEGTALITAHLGPDAGAPVIGTTAVMVQAGEGDGPGDDGPGDDGPGDDAPDNTPDAAASTVSASPGSVAADSTATITVQLRDSAGNPVDRSGDSVFLATDLGTLTPAGGTTTTGVFQAAFTSPVSGEATLTAYLGADADAPVIGVVSVTVVAGPADPGQSGLSGLSGGGTDAGVPEMPVGGTLRIEIQLRDAQGNRVSESGAPVFLTTDLGELVPDRGSTTEGRFEAAFTSSETGTATVAAYLGEDESGPAIGTLSVTVRERTADPGASTLTSTQTRISQSGSATLRVQLRDAEGEPMTTTGTPVFLTSSRGQVTPQSGTTTNGEFTAVFTSSQNGNTVIRAYLGENAQGPLVGSVEIVVQGGGGNASGDPARGAPGASEGR